MNYYLIQFKAEYYCQGYEWGTFQRLVKANDYAEAVTKLRYTKTNDYDPATIKDCKDLTIQ